MFALQIHFRRTDLTLEQTDIVQPIPTQLVLVKVSIFLVSCLGKELGYSHCIFSIHDLLLSMSCENL